MNRLIWRTPSNRLTRSKGYIPQFGEPNFPYEQDTCFNCGGTFLIEIGNAELGHESVVCPFCEGDGDADVAYPDYTYDDWVRLEIQNVAIFNLPDGQINWNP